MQLWESETKQTTTIHAHQDGSYFTKASKKERLKQEKAKAAASKASEAQTSATSEVGKDENTSNGT